MKWFLVNLVYFTGSLLFAKLFEYMIWTLSLKALTWTRFSGKLPLQLPSHQQSQCCSSRRTTLNWCRRWHAPEMQRVQRTIRPQRQWRQRSKAFRKSSSKLESNSRPSTHCAILIFSSTARLQSSSQSSRNFNVSRTLWRALDFNWCILHCLGFSELFIIFSSLCDCCFPLCQLLIF